MSDKTISNKTSANRNKSNYLVQAAEILESISDGFCAFDRDWRIVYVNQLVASYLGSSTQEMLGQNLWEKYPRLIHTPIEENFRAAMEQSHLRAFETHGILTDKWYNIRVYPSTNGISVYWQDITDRKKAEKALARAKDELEIKVKERTAELAESEEKYRLLVDNASEVIMVAQDGLIKFVNQQGLKPTGYSPEEMTDKPFRQFVYPDDRKAVEKEVRRHIEDQPVTSNYKFRFVTKDGSIRWAIMNAVNIPWEGKPAILSIVTDITERELAEEKITYLLGLRTLLTDISTRFVNVPVDRLDQEIQDAQRRLCEYLDLDISSSYLPSPETAPSLKLTYLYRRLEKPPVPETLVARDYFPWCEKQLVSGQVVVVPNTQDLPTEATRDRASWKHFGIRSSLMFPLLAGEKVIGTLSFDTVRKSYSWPEELVGGLKLIAQVFANAIIRKQFEEALKESEAKANALIKYAPTAIYQLDIRGPRIVSVNDVMSVVSGYTREELLAMNPNQLLDESSRKLFAERIKRMLTGEKVEETVDYKARKKDGSLIDVTLQISFSKKDPNILLVIAHDITERKQAEEAVKSSEEKYRMVVENASEAIVITQDGLLRYFNRRLSENTGYSAEELTSRPFLDFHPEDRKKVAEIYRQRIAGEAVPESYEYRVIVKDGSTRWMRMNATLITLEGRPATLNIFTDITEAKNLRDQIIEYARRITQVQEEERKRIAYELHDDTAQYLSILKMQLDSLLQSEKIQSPEIKEKLQYLEKDADRAFQDVRRYSHELRPVTLERSGLVAAFEQVIDDYNKLGQLPVTIKVAGPEPELSEEVKLGFFRIAQEALNNIRKHAKASQATIIISFQEKRLEMSVTDNGNGFDVKEAATRASGKGSLGLMSMKERADLIGASLNIDSKPGQGTTVRVEIPLQSLI